MQTAMHYISHHCLVSLLFSIAHTISPHTYYWLEFLICNEPSRHSSYKDLHAVTQSVNESVTS